MKECYEVEIGNSSIATDAYDRADAFNQVVVFKLAIGLDDPIGRIRKVHFIPKDYKLFGDNDPVFESVEAVKEYCRREFDAGNETNAAAWKDYYNIVPMSSWMPAY